jgi:hypothetical protein
MCNLMPSQSKSLLRRSDFFFASFFLLSSRRSLPALMLQHTQKETAGIPSATTNAKRHVEDATPCALRLVQGKSWRTLPNKSSILLLAVPHISSQLAKSVLNG